MVHNPLQVERYFETFDTDIIDWEIGPHHPALPGLMRLRLSLDGEIIVKSRFSLGYNHKGIEKEHERQRWFQSVPLSNHIDPSHALFFEFLFCSTVEKMSGISVPPRAQYVRAILKKLNFIDSILRYFSRVAQSVSAETVSHYFLRDREEILDVLELAAGNRFSPNVICFGGVQEDVTEGFLDRVLDACKVIENRVDEYDRIFLLSAPFVKRARGAGYLSLTDINRWGVTGLNAVPGDVYRRVSARRSRLFEALKVLRELVREIPDGKYCDSNIRVFEFSPPSGEAYQTVESPRGILGCFVLSDGAPFPKRVQWRTPSLMALAASADCLKGNRIEDVSLIYSSLDIALSEIDR